MSRNPSSSWRGSGKGIDAFDHLFGDSPRNRDRGTRYPAGGPAPPARPAFSLPTATWPARRETFTKLYTSLTALNIHTAIRVRPQFNPECRVSKAYRNILQCRFAERKVICVEIWRWLLKLASKNYVSIASFLSSDNQDAQKRSNRASCSTGRHFHWGNGVIDAPGDQGGLPDRSNSSTSLPTPTRLRRIASRNCRQGGNSHRARHGRIAGQGPK